MAITLDGSNVNTVGVVNRQTDKSATGTSVDFTGIPSGVRRVTVMFNGVSSSGSSNIQIQIGSGSIVTSGYVGVAGSFAGGVGSAAYTGSGFIITNSMSPSQPAYGLMILTNISSNVWICSSNITQTSANRVAISDGVLSLSGVLDRLRLTTVNGTDTFNAGTINILYE